MDFRAVHVNLGVVFITGECVALQATNPDMTSVFVFHEGEIKEVSKCLVKTDIEYIPMDD